MSQNEGGGEMELGRAESKRRKGPEKIELRERERSLSNWYRDRESVRRKKVGREV